MQKIKFDKYFYAHSSIYGRKKFIFKQVVLLVWFLLFLSIDTTLFYMCQDFVQKNNFFLRNIILSLAIVILVLSLLSYLIYNIIEVKFFYLSQKLFHKTKTFKNLKQQTLKHLKQANKKQLKQYCRLNFIDKKTFQECIKKLEEKSNKS